MGKFQPGNKAAVGHGRPRVDQELKLERFRWDIRKLCEAHDFQPFEKLIDLAMNSRSSMVQFNAAAELCSYIMPKLKGIDFTGKEKSPFVINMNLTPSKVEVSSNEQA